MFILLRPDPRLRRLLHLLDGDHDSDEHSHLSFSVLVVQLLVVQPLKTPCFHLNHAGFSSSLCSISLLLLLIRPIDVSCSLRVDSLSPPVVYMIQYVPVPPRSALLGPSVSCRHDEQL